MSILTTDRAVKINNDFSKSDKDWARTVSDITRQSDLTIQLTAWMHDNILNNKGDVDEADRISFRASFQTKMLEINTQLEKLLDASAVYNADTATYQANLDAFKAKYAINISEIDKRYS